MRRLSLLLTLIATSTMSVACATIGHGVRQDIYVTSEPRGALVSIGSKVVGPTPTVVTVFRRSKPTLRFEMDGFEPLSLPVERSVSGLVGLDAIALNPMSCQGLNSWKGCPGLLLANLAWFFGTDFLTGAAFKFPNTVNGVLIKK